MEFIALHESAFVRAVLRIVVHRCAIVRVRLFTRLLCVCDFFQSVIVIDRERMGILEKIRDIENEVSAGWLSMFDFPAPFVHLCSMSFVFRLLVLRKTKRQK